MKTFFNEKYISNVRNAEGEVVEFFMRPIKIKELPIINRVGMLAEEPGAEEFAISLLISLMLDCLSIDGRNIPEEETRGLIDIFIEYNFPKKEEKESDKSKTKKSPEPLSFFIDFLVNQGHTNSDIMEMTMPQFNELIVKAGERLSPSTKKMDPLVAFRKMGIPIRNRGKNGR